MDTEYIDQKLIYYLGQLNTYAHLVSERWQTKYPQFNEYVLFRLALQHFEPDSYLTTLNYIQTKLGLQALEECSNNYLASHKNEAINFFEDNLMPKNQKSDAIFEIKKSRPLQIGRAQRELISKISQDLLTQSKMNFIAHITIDDFVVFCNHYFSSDERLRNYLKLSHKYNSVPKIRAINRYRFKIVNHYYQEFIRSYQDKLSSGTNTPLLNWCFALLLSKYKHLQREHEVTVKL